MNDLYAWASSQPIWLQVVIGLAVFSIGLPLILLSGWLCILAFAFVLGRIIVVIDFLFSVFVPPILFMITLCIVLYGVLEISESMAWELAFATRAVIRASPTELETRFQWLTIVITTLILFLIGAVLYFKRASLLSRLWKIFSPRQWPREEA